MINSKNELELFIQEYLDIQFKELGILPGVAVVVADKKNIDKFTFGYRDRENKIEVTEDTLFSVSSLSKAFTAIAFIIESTKSAYDITSPVNLNTNDLIISDQDIFNKVTISDILSHQSGFPAFDLLWYFNTKELIKIENKIKYIDPIPGAFEKEFNYSNLLYSTLNFLFYKKFKKNLNEYLHNNILSKISMNDSTFQYDMFVNSKNKAKGYNLKNVIPYKNTDLIFPAGGLYTNINDFSRWLSFLLSKLSNKKTSNSSIFENIELLFSSKIKINSRPHMLLNGFDWLSVTDYAYGWFLGNFENLSVFFHTGFIDGFSSAIVIIPEIEFGVTVFTNLNMSSLPGEIIYRILLKKINNEINFNLVNRGEIIFPFPKGLDSKLYSAEIDYSGHYFNPNFQKLTIKKKNSSYAIVFDGCEYDILFQNESFAFFNLRAFDINIPMQITFIIKDKRAISCLIPLAFDPRVNDLSFVRI